MDEIQNNQTAENQSKKSFFRRNALIFKPLIIGFIVLLLLIPMSMVNGLIDEREYTARQAGNEVHAKWGGPQTIAGPVITYSYETKDAEGKSYTKRLHYLPDELKIAGAMNSQIRKRGIYEVVVYNVPLVLDSHFRKPSLSMLGLTEAEFKTLQVTMSVGISDMRGMSERIYTQYADAEKLIFQPGITSAAEKLFNRGVSVNLNPEYLKNSETEMLHFPIHLQFRGSQKLMLAPLGNQTQVNLTGNYGTPSFTGAYLPDTRQVGDTSFTADWKMLDINRSYGQFLSNENYWHQTIDESAFGVELLLPVDQYQQSTRAVKYAFLIIILTFVVNFFVEIIRRKNIHPLQYVLVGLALCLFYTLLVALSEYLGFTMAYGAAAVMTIGMITCYMMGMLRIRRTALAIGGLLAALYAYIFVLIRLENYALLAGSIGLFVILGIVMYFSQKINWNGEK